MGQGLPIHRDVSAAEAARRLAGLKRSGLLGSAALWAYESLFRQAGHRAGGIKFTAGALGTEFGRDRRTALDWIEALCRAGLLEIDWRQP